MPTDLGTKYTCFKCEAKFYDLKRPAPLCPKCGADQRDKPAVAEKPAKKKTRATEPASRELDDDVEDDGEDDVESSDDDEPFDDDE